MIARGMQGGKIMRKRKWKIWKRLDEKKNTIKSTKKRQIRPNTSR